MPETDPIPALAELLRASKLPLAVFRDRFARSAFYDPHYRIMVIAAALSIVGKSDVSGTRSIQESRLKLLQFIGSRPWLLTMVQEWSRTRRSGRFSVFSPQRLRRGFLGDTTHDQVVNLLLAHGGLLRAGGKLISPATGPLDGLYVMAVNSELFVAERDTLAQLSRIKITNKMLEGE